MGVRQQIIGAGFDVIGATRLHRLAVPFTRGLGAILMFHHVRPARPTPFDPNGLLAITPDFLDAALLHVRQAGYAIVSLDEAMARLQEPERSRQPWVALTFDDGYRDNRDHALPILERYEAPATVFVTTGFADRSARLWWLELEKAVLAADRVKVTIGEERIDMPAITAAEKRAAFEAVYWPLRQGSEERLLDVIAALCAAQGIDGAALVARECMDWPEIEVLARHPLVTIGAHTESHPMLGKHPEPRARREIVEPKGVLESRLGVPIRHLAYPVGDRSAAGAREFEMARQAGYLSAVTTRPGLVFRGHAAHPTALPRVSVNGLYQSLGNLDVLLSGLAFALWNRGRRVDAA